MKLESIRAEIDEIDAAIQDLLHNRAKLGKKVAEVKRQLKLSHFFVPEREAQTLRRVAERCDGSLPENSVVQIFREIISATRDLEKPTRIAILGPEGTFTQAAAMQHFGHAFTAVFRPTIDDVFNAVEVGRAEFGVVPVENSTEGVVNSTLDCLIDSSLSLCGEIELKVHHSLLSLGAEISEVTKVLAHPQALAQCRKWLSRNLPDAELVSSSSNAEAVVKVLECSHHAAIASIATAKIYNLNTLASNIEDQRGNTTRFLVIGNISTESTGYDKTSILLSKQNRPGSLVNLLQPFAALKINMSKIESRPSRKAMWDYVFFIDFEGHAKDEKVVSLFEILKQEALLFKHLGSYPRSAK